MHSQIVGSCDGLILIQKNKKYNFAAILGNPITLEYAILPKPSSDLDMFGIYGLGYDSYCDDYKVVRLAWSGSLENRVDIYSVKMKCWRRVGDSPYPHNDTKSGVFLNGCIHWMCGGFPLEHSVTIVAFDLAREEFNQMSLPSSVVVEKLDSLAIKVLKGRLTLICEVPKWSNSFDVWVMEEYGVFDSWTKVTTINWPHEKSAYLNECLGIFSCMLNGDEILMKMYDSQLLAYNWRTRVWRDVVVSGYKGTFGSTFMTFGESIVFPNS